MASFVFIHGSWLGGWTFDPVAQVLEAAGHEVMAPDLPGMGGDDAKLAAVTLEKWGRFAADQCRAATQTPVILIGHSRGGLVISEAGEQAPKVIDALVYVCAMLLPSGMSRTDWKEFQQANPAFDAIIRPLPSGHGTTVDPAGVPAVFAQLSDRAAAEEMAARTVAEPAAPRATKLKLSADRYHTIPRYYVECLHDLTIPIADQRAMQALTPCTDTITLDADHSPFLSATEALAKALLAIAERT